MLKSLQSSVFQVIYDLSVSGLNWFLGGIVRVRCGFRNRETFRR